MSQVIRLEWHHGRSETYLFEKVDESKVACYIVDCRGKMYSFTRKLEASTFFRHGLVDWFTFVPWPFPGPGPRLMED